MANLLSPYPDVGVDVTEIAGEKGSTDFVKIVIPGMSGKRAGGGAPTPGVAGWLGGIGARPSRNGLVSDAEDAIAAVATALKLAHMRIEGDALPGDVIVTTHVCPDAPTRTDEPMA